MPFALVVIGLIMIVTGSRNTYAQFGAQVASDFTGPGNFTYWLASLGFVGAVGYIPQLKQLSHIFLALIIIVMVLHNGNPGTTGGGLFQRIQDFLKTGPTAPQAAQSNAPVQPVPGQPATTSQPIAADKAASKIIETVPMVPLLF